MKINKLLTATAALLVAVSAMAQMSTSPYSKFGYGLLNDNATAAQRQMGSVGYAMNSGRQINVMNPASYAAIDTLTFLFDVGVDFSIINSKQPAQSADIPAASLKQKGGGLDYIAMQVPIGKCMGASLGLLPFSSVGYSFGSKIDNGVNSHEGQGGINQLYLGFAGRIFKGFTIGANASYLFGHSVNDVYVTTDGGSTSLFEQVLKVNDYRIQFGVQYTYEIDRRHSLSAGLVYTPGKALAAKGEVVKYDVNLDKEPETLFNESVKKQASLPESWGAGLSYRFDKRLLVEADVTYQPWSKAKSPKMIGFESTKFDNRYQVGFGAEYRPSLRGNYLQRITYRLGANYNRDYIMVGDNHVRDYTISCGFGFPTLGSKTIINLGFEYHNRQSTPMSLLTENYFNIRLGINFNELWFFQNKIK